MTDEIAETFWPRFRVFRSPFVRLLVQLFVRGVLFQLGGEFVHGVEIAQVDDGLFGRNVIFYAIPADVDWDGTSS